MKRIVAAVLASLVTTLGAHGVAEGQQPGVDAPVPQAVPDGRLNITPFFGWRPPAAQDRRETVIVPGVLLPLAVDIETRPGGVGTAGLEAELRLMERVGVTGALAFSNAENRVLTAETPGGNFTQVSLRGPSLWFARAGLSIRLPEPVPDQRASRSAAYLMLGPAVVREEYGDGVLALPGRGDRQDNWAMHFGIKGIVPIGMPGVFVHLSAENYATFWNPRDAERARVERAMQLQPGTLLNASLGANRTHLFMGNVGVSIRI